MCADSAYLKDHPIFERAAFGLTSFGPFPQINTLGWQENVIRRMKIMARKSNHRAEILGMVNSGKTSAAEAARLFGLHRSSVSRLISQARAESAAIVG
jgi:DNA-directed RNA polymerase specialized sigma24 family protein